MSFIHTSNINKVVICICIVYTSVSIIKAIKGDI